jgi:ElaB/YqjD/DUF883 family membrane-anchored ribosome-binding protein
MNDQKLDKKVRQDADRVKKDLSTLAEDGAARINRFENNVSVANADAQKDLTKWAEDSVSQLNKNFDKLTSSARETAGGAVATMKKDIGHGLSQYNAKAQDIADKVPDGFAKKVARYPWVVITIGLAIGFLLGLLLQPARQPIEQVQI